MRYRILPIIILAIVGAGGFVMLKESNRPAVVTPAAEHMILHGSYVSTDPRLGYLIDFDKYPGTAWFLAGQGGAMASAYTVNGNTLHLAMCILDLTLMPDGTIQCPPCFGPMQSIVILKKRG